MEKTVYILGAGFSKEAGAPSQERLIEQIFQINHEYPNVFIPESVKTFKDFLTNTLNIPEDLHSKVPLEDVFTPLDRCIEDNISFRSLQVDDIREIRNLTYYLIGRTLQYLLQNSQKGYVDHFAKYLVNKSIVRANGNFSAKDPVTVMTTNWDILLDNSIKSAISETKGDGVVDYCCHISSFAPNDHTVKPGLEVLGRGGYIVKLLKLHGSLNWLNCPRCMRLYVDFYNKIAISQYREQHSCRHCDKNFGQHKSHILSSNLIMPTFLKNLSNPQYKLIWQNAGIELAEAKKIVFIGYSLPQADFEMRQLLSRMIRSDAKIEVVDYGPNNPPNIIDLKNRYSIFFGKRTPKFYLNGAKHYIENNLEQ